MEHFVLIPSYTPLLTFSKYYETLGDGVLDVIEAGYLALRNLLQHDPPSWILLSLADFNAKINRFRENVNTLLWDTSKSSTKVIMDCGVLERHMSKYLKDKQLFCDPLANLVAQTSLPCLPSIVTLLDDLDDECTFSGLLKHEDEVINILDRVSHSGTKALLVIHAKDIQHSLFESVVASKIVLRVGFVAIPDDELDGDDGNLSRIRKLAKHLLVLGIDEFSPGRLIRLLSHNISMGDVAKWYSHRLVLQDDSTIRIEEINVDELVRSGAAYLGGLVNNARNNLLVLKRVEHLTQLD